MGVPMFGGLAGLSRLQLAPDVRQVRKLSPGQVALHQTDCSPWIGCKFLSKQAKDVFVLPCRIKKVWPSNNGMTNLVALSTVILQSAERVAVCSLQVEADHHKGTQSSGIQEAVCNSPTDTAAAGRLNAHQWRKALLGRPGHSSGLPRCWEPGFGVREVHVMC